MATRPVAAGKGVTSERLWHEFQARIHAWFRTRTDSTTADDLTQETFLRIHQGLGRLRDEDRVAAWVFQIARNVWIDHGRREAARPTTPLQDEPVAQPESASNLNEVVGGWFEGFLNEMPSDQAQAVRLADLQGRKQSELAAELGLSPSGLKSRVQRGRHQLRSMLLECCELERDGSGNVLDYRPRTHAKDCPCCKP